MNTDLGLQFSASRGTCSPRSRIRIDLPVGASRCAKVAPPAPEPTTTMSKCGMALTSPRLIQMILRRPGGDNPPPQRFGQAAQQGGGEFVVPAGNDHHLAAFVAADGRRDHR